MIDPHVVPCIFAVLHALESNVDDYVYNIIAIAMLACIVCVLEERNMHTFAWCLVLPPALLAIFGCGYSSVVEVCLGEQ